MPQYGKILGHDSKPRYSTCNDSNRNSLLTACRNRSLFARRSQCFTGQCFPYSPSGITDPRISAQAPEGRSSPCKTSPNKKLGAVKDRLVHPLPARDDGPHEVSPQLGMVQCKTLAPQPHISPQPVGEKEETFCISPAFHLHGYKK